MHLFSSYFNSSSLLYFSPQAIFFVTLMRTIFICIYGCKRLKMIEVEGRNVTACFYLVDLQLIYLQFLRHNQYSIQELGYTLCTKLKKNIWCQCLLEFVESSKYLRDNFDKIAIEQFEVEMRTRISFVVAQVILGFMVIHVKHRFHE